MKELSNIAQAVQASTTLAIDAMAKQMKADGIDVGQQTKISDGVTDNFEQWPFFNLFACPALGVPANSFDDSARPLCLSDDLISGNADQLHRI